MLEYDSGVSSKETMARNLLIFYVVVVLLLAQLRAVQGISKKTFKKTSNNSLTSKHLQSTDTIHELRRRI
tara:strand:+ start:73 stop:282 length:210 start_codon:yes stop_codon:yes gene_type:complete